MPVREKKTTTSLGVGSREGRKPLRASVDSLRAGDCEDEKVKEAVTRTYERRDTRR